MSLLCHRASRLILACVVLTAAEAPAPEAQARAVGAGAREAFLRLLDRPRVPLSPDGQPMTAADSTVVRERFTFASQQGERVPGVLLKPRAGMRESATAAERAYRTLDAADRFVLHIQPKTGHAFGEPARQAAIEWFVRWLQP